MTTPKLKSEHFFERTWQFYIQRYEQNTKSSYQSQLHPVGSFKSITEFWNVMQNGTSDGTKSPEYPPILKELHELSTTTIIYLMANDIKPIWEDSDNLKSFTVRFKIDFPSLPDSFDKTKLGFCSSPQNISFYKVCYATRLIFYLIGEQYRKREPVINGLTIRYGKGQFFATFWLNNKPEQTFFDIIQKQIPFLSSTMNPDIEVVSIEEKLFDAF